MEMENKGVYARRMCSKSGSFKIKYSFVIKYCPLVAERGSSGPVNRTSV